MNVGDIFQVNNAWNAEEVNKTRKTYAVVEEETTPSGDTVSISQEARELYSKMIHKYDKGTSQSTQDENAAPEANGDAPQGGQSLGDSDNSGSSVEELKEKIQALKSQLMSLAGQAQKTGPDSGIQSQMSALQAQISSLEAQLNAMSA